RPPRASTVVPEARPLRCSRHRLRRERRHHFAGEELDRLQSVRTAHARNVHPADELGRAQLVAVALDLPDRVVGVADDETVLEALEVDLLLVGDQLTGVGPQLPLALRGLRAV